MVEPPGRATAVGVARVPAPAGACLDTAWRTGLGLLVLPPALLLASAAALVLALARAPRRWIDAVYVGYARLCVRLVGTQVVTHGREHLQPGRAYIVVANHESSWDPVVLTAGLAPLPLRWVVKRQLIAIPVFGRALLRTGNVRVVRVDTEGDVARIRAEMARRPSDVSMIFFAEGTRSRDGALQPFKKGAFVTAVSWGLPVLPVGIAGTRRVWPPLSLRLRSGPVVLEVGAPIPVDGLTLADRDRLRDTTEAAVRGLRAQARRQLRALGVDPGGID
jgi:1-acyl-sn-glycerol-3-phosphate acyltransferase